MSGGVKAMYESRNNLIMAGKGPKRNRTWNVGTYIKPLAFWRCPFRDNENETRYNVLPCCESRHFALPCWQESKRITVCRYASDYKLKPPCNYVSIFAKTSVWDLFYSILFSAVTEMGLCVLIKFTSENVESHITVETGHLPHHCSQS